MLVGTLAGERPVSGTCPVATVVISGGGAGDQSVGSPDVNVLVGWGDPVSSDRRANKSTGRSAAAMLVGVLAGESPAGGDRPVATVVIPGDGAGDQSVESPGVKVLVGWAQAWSAPTGG
jgi:hypothetical protein